jgi:hypothetical protein
MTSAAALTNDRSPLSTLTTSRQRTPESHPPRQVLKDSLNHETFYQKLITRNELLISSELQEKLRQGRFLIAGCGSIGSAIVEPLVRIGAENLLIAEPDTFDTSNLNRQQARLEDVGVNKGIAVKRQVEQISPFAKIEVLENGITDANLEQALDQVAVIFDGIDVTTPRPIHIKVKMHEEAKRQRIPVISGYDIAGLQLLVIYRYDREATKVLHGTVSAKDFENGKELRPVDFLFRVIPLRFVPFEIFRAVELMLSGKDFGFPQVVYTAKAFGNMALTAALEILEGRATRRYVAFDHHAALRPWRQQIRLRMRWFVGLTKLLVSYVRSR